MKGRRGFTLIELLVVVAIIGLLLAIVVPSLQFARRCAIRTGCLANMRGLEQAHWMYMTDYNSRMIRVGIAHGGMHANAGVAWINTLQKYYGNNLLCRSPADDSPHWGPYPAGESIPGAPPAQRRLASYGCNDFLDPDTCPWGGPYRMCTDVPRPAGTVHFLIMAFTGEFAGADHPHVENWTGGGNQPPLRAAAQVQINVHGGAVGWEAVSNWGFLDGHAATLKFREVFTKVSSDLTGRNKFDPRVAQ